MQPAAQTLEKSLGSDNKWNVNYAGCVVNVIGWSGDAQKLEAIVDRFWRGVDTHPQSLPRPLVSFVLVAFGAGRSALRFPIHLFQHLQHVADQRTATIEFAAGYLSTIRLLVQQR